MNRIWCNGLWIDPHDFSIAPTDRGLLHGMGLFETILAIAGRPVFADRHLKRLSDACSRLDWQVKTTDLPDVMCELLERNQLGTGHARIRLALTAGSGALDDLSLGGDHLLWMSASAASVPPMQISVNVSPFTRNQHSPLAGLKCASYAENLIALDHARRRGFEETLFFNSAGHLCEAAAANVFLVKNGSLLTPALDGGCLPGITRGLVIEIAAKLAIPIHETRLNRDDLLHADEVFLTSSTRGPVAVIRVGEQSFTGGKLTATLRSAWKLAVRHDAGHEK